MKKDKNTGIITGQSIINFNEFKENNNKTKLDFNKNTMILTEDSCIGYYLLLKLLNLLDLEVCTINKDILNYYDIMKIKHYNNTLDNNSKLKVVTIGGIENLEYALNYFNKYNIILDIDYVQDNPKVLTYLETLKNKNYINLHTAESLILLLNKYSNNNILTEINNKNNHLLISHLDEKEKRWFLQSGGFEKFISKIAFYRYGFKKTTRDYKISDKEALTKILDLTIDDKFDLNNSLGNTNYFQE